MQITAPRFDFQNLVQSHGWVHLAPWQWSPNDLILSRPMNIRNGDAVPITIHARHHEDKSVIHWRHNGSLNLTATDRLSIRSQIRRMLCLDIDYSSFHNLCSQDSRLEFVARKRCGGMLRCPTVFEDLVKTVCTTNCDWRNTERMCESLCRLKEGAFPTPESLLQYSVTDLAQKVPLGYRAETVLDIAKLFHEDNPPLDELARTGQFQAIKDFLKRINGVGPYSVNHMLVLLGYYGEIPVDSEVLKYVSKTHFRGKPITPKQAVAPYDEYGDFRFLAYKFLRMAQRMNGKE
jgi:3-methyladenine DNA glycosylase/8-oxoguanine DNA glycosylase